MPLRSLITVELMPVDIDIKLFTVLQIEEVVGHRLPQVGYLNLNRKAESSSSAADRLSLGDFERRPHPRSEMPGDVADKQVFAGLESNRQFT